ALFESSSGPFEYELPTDGGAQEFVPIRAALALVRIACSICPESELDECRGAIDWLMGTTSFEADHWPVIFGFTPGPINDNCDEVLLLRRRTDGSIPYMWLVARFGNYQLQSLVPLCPADQGWFRTDGANSFQCMSYPSRFGQDWPYGASSFV